MPIVDGGAESLVCHYVPLVWIFRLADRQSRKGPLMCFGTSEKGATVQRKVQSCQEDGGSVLFHF